MLWGWPPFPEPGLTAQFNISTVEWVQTDSLHRSKKRLLVRNDYGQRLGILMQTEIEREFTGRDNPGALLLGGLLDFDRWVCDARGVSAPFRVSVSDLLNTPEFFATFLKPTALAMRRLMRNLTEAMTRIDCDSLDHVLHRIELGPLPPDDLAELRATPQMLPEDQIRRNFESHGWSEELLEALLPPVRARCSAKPGADPSDLWRKGFGYSTVYSGPADGGHGEMRIMPAVYLGSGGIVESLLVDLGRVSREAPQGGTGP